MRILVFAVLALVGCSERRWLPSERWLASPAAQYGIPDGEPWRCIDGYGPNAKEWKARLSKDGYYWCYQKDAH
jgi:hypothetical protein